MKTAWLTAYVLAVLSCASAQRPDTAQSEYTAFVDFSVVPMDTPRVLRNHTVLVSDGVVRTVGPAPKVHVPRGARVIRGDGSYLTPALADVHTHTAEDPELRLLLTEGVTTILNLGSRGHCE